MSESRSAAASTTVEAGAGVAALAEQFAVPPTDQLQFEDRELLQDPAYVEPLVTDGVRCHGGFVEDGTYRSPRTEHRVPAILSWEAQRLTVSGGAPALTLPLDTWPEHFPNVEQSKFLMRKGVPGPTITELTRIGTVEGFGALLSALPVPDMQAMFEDDIRGSATAHLARGLFEAHARDEAGWHDEAGHDRMWFAARDIAFEHPVTEDQTARMLDRLGIPRPGGPGPDFATLRRKAMENRVLPDDVDFDVESMLTRMISLLFIEIQAFHGFAWAESVLADVDLCAGDGEAARIISYVRADETPHVAYLQVALSEMRDWTWRGSNGRSYDGADMISRLWDRALEQSLFLRFRGEFLRFVVNEIEHFLADRSDQDDVMDELYSLGTVRPLAEGGFVERNRAGDEVLIP